MKYGLCTNFVKEENGFSVPALDFIKRNGYDYIEVNLNAIAGLSDEDFISLKQYFNSVDLKVCSSNCLLPGYISITGPKYNKKDLETYLEKAVSRAKELGIKKMVLGSGASRNIPAQFPRETAEKQIFEAICITTKIAEKYDIVLVLEHLNKCESNILSTFKETAEFVKKVNSPYCKCLVDTYHFYIGREDPSIIKEYADQLAHIHFCRVLGRAYPDLLDFPEIYKDLEFVKDINYNENISIESCLSFSAERLNEEAQDGIIDKLREYFC